MKLLISLLLGLIFKSISATESKRPDDNKSIIEEAPDLEQEEWEGGKDSSGSQENQDASPIKLPSLEDLLQEHQKADSSMHEESSQFDEAWKAVIEVCYARLVQFPRQKMRNEVEYFLGNVQSLLEDGGKLVDLLEEDCNNILEDSRRTCAKMETFYPNGSSEPLNFDAAFRMYWQSVTSTNKAFTSKVEKRKEIANVELGKISTKLEEQVSLAKAELDVSRAEYENFGFLNFLKEARPLLAGKRERFGGFVELLKQLSMPFDSHNPPAIGTTEEAAMAQEMSRMRKKMRSLLAKMGKNIATRENEFEVIRSDFFRSLDEWECRVTLKLEEMAPKIWQSFVCVSRLVEKCRGQEKKSRTRILSETLDPSSGGKSTTWDTFFSQRKFLTLVRGELNRSLRYLKIGSSASFLLQKRAQKMGETIQRRVDTIKDFFATLLDTPKTRSKVLADVDALFVLRSGAGVFFEDAQGLVESELKNGLKYCQKYMQIHCLSDHQLELEETRNSLVLTLENFDGDLEAYIAMLSRRRDQFRAWQRVLIDEWASVRKEYRKVRSTLPKKKPIDEGFLDSLSIKDKAAKLEQQEINSIKDIIRLLEQKSTNLLEDVVLFEKFRDADKETLASLIVTFGHLIDETKYISDKSLLAHLYEEWAEKVKSELLLLIREKYEPRFTNGK